MLQIEAIRMLAAEGGGRKSRRVDEGGEGEKQSLLIPGIPDDIALNCLALARRIEHPKLACLNTKFSSLVDSGYLYELRRRMRISEQWVYMVCDPPGWQAFVPGENRWLQLPRIPCDDCFQLSDKESLAVGHRLLVFGKEIWNFAVWAYSGPRRGWSRCRPMNHPRCLFASGASGAIAIVAGGIDKTSAVLRSAELYNSETDTWEILPQMHKARRLCSGFFMSGKFYVVGGMSGINTPPLTCGEEYDPKVRSWRLIEGMCPMPGKAIGAPPLVAVVENKLYAVEPDTNMVKCYDALECMWTVIGRLPVRADMSNGWGLAFKAFGSELLVVGGQRGEGIVLSKWRPGGGGPPEWEVIGVKEQSGVFVYNCAVVGC